MSIKNKWLASGVNLLAAVQEATDGDILPAYVVNSEFLVDMKKSNLVEWCDGKWCLDEYGDYVVVIDDSAPSYENVGELIAFSKQK